MLTSLTVSEVFVPTYSYACTECDNKFDQVQAFTDDALTECPQCSGRLRKLFGKVGVVFKGSGFYRTDSREDSKKKSSSSSSSALAPAIGNRRTNWDAKPQATGIGCIAATEWPTQHLLQQP